MNINGTISETKSLSGSITPQKQLGGSVSGKQQYVGNITQTLLRGVGIKSIEQIASSIESNGENIVEIALTDGSRYRYSVYNGKQGQQGDQGFPGKSPYFNKSDKRWYEWDDTINSYVPSTFEGAMGISEPATPNTLGAIKVGENLKITDEGVLSVDTSSSIYDDNTKPITSAAVYKEIGNIGALLQTI